VERKQLEKEDEIWEKNIVRKVVPLPARWTGKMENGKETSLGEDFVVMAFGDVFVKELKMSPGGWVDIPVGDSAISSSRSSQLKGYWRTKSAF
jgi:hypothetical protein